MAHPTLSSEGPREQFSTTLTEAQRKLLEEARDAGYSKQQVITQGLPLLSFPLPKSEEDESGNRKTVRFRCSPEVMRQLREVCGRNPDGTKVDPGGEHPTYGQVIQACAERLLGK